MLKQLFENKLAVGMIIILVAFGLWYGLASPSSSNPTLLASSASPDGTGAASTADQSSQDLVQTLLALRAVNLDGAIFTNPAFATLLDFSTQIVPEPVGRTNPFAPLGDTAPAAAAAAAAVPAASTAPTAVPTATPQPGKTHIPAIRNTQP